MNGRVYLPEIGRFLSPDPFVQFPESTQGYNRYTYVGNNPLSYADPSGFFLKKLMSVVGMALNFVPGFQGWGNAFIRGFITGFLSGGGDLKAGLLGGIGGAAFGAVGEMKFGLGKIMAHGVIGGALSAAGGGRFGDGFLGAAAAQAFAPAIDKIGRDAGGNISTDVSARAARVAAAAVVGGTAARLGGGKFASGAITAAFARMFNDEVHIRRNINQPSSGSITFQNDDPLGASPDQPVTANLAQAVEDVVSQTGFDININSTTGGDRLGGPHPQGRAVDINRINGMRVDDPLNVDNVRTLQEAFMRHPNVNQVLGPVHNQNLWRGAPAVSPALIQQHRDHVHITGKR